jgi:Sir2 family
MAARDPPRTRAHKRPAPCLPVHRSSNHAGVTAVGVKRRRGPRRRDDRDRGKPAVRCPTRAAARGGPLRAVITQNIDGLHQKAGSGEVLDVHSSVRKLVCVCSVEIARADSEPLLASDAVPYCPDCEQRLKPHVVLFGERLPERALGRAYALAHECDLILCIGSSLPCTRSRSCPSTPVSAAPGSSRSRTGRPTMTSSTCTCSSRSTRPSRGLSLGGLPVVTERERMGDTPRRPGALRPDCIAPAELGFSARRDTAATR